MKTLALLEKLAERLIEGPFERLFKPRLHPADLAKALASAMEQGQISDGRGGVIAPNHYQVALNQADYQALREQSDLGDEIEAIKRYLAALMAETHNAAPGAVQVAIQPQIGLQPGQISITADHLGRAEPASAGQTALPDTQKIDRLAAAKAGNWYLRLPAQQIRLGMPVVRIGRAGNNDITLADETVAPYHAQLRWRNGAYYAQNLSRTRPLGLNGQPVEGSIRLNPGDALQLGNLTLRIELIP